MDNVFDLVKDEHRCAIDDSKQQQPMSFKEKNEDGTPYEPTAEECTRNGFETQLYQPFSAQFSQACDLLKKSGYFPQTYEHLQIDGATRDDLKVFRGPQRARDSTEEKRSEFDCLANKVNYTFTSAGKVVLCTQLARPPASVEHLIARNLKLNALLTLHRDSQNQRSLHPNFNTLETHLKNAAAGESIFLSFFDPNDRFADFLRRSKTNLPLAKKIDIIKKVENWLNDNQLYLYVQEATPILMSVPNVLLSASSEIFNFGKLLFPETCKQFLRTLGFSVEEKPKNPSRLQLALQSIEPFMKFFKLAFGAKAIGDLADMRQMVTFMIGYNLTNIKYMRKKLHHTNKFIRALKDTQKVLQELRSYNNGNMLVDLQLPQSVKAKEVMELLNDSTFAEDHNNLCYINGGLAHWAKGKALVHWGKIKLAYKRMCETKDEFIKPLAALALLDYHMGSARLIVNNPAPLIRGSTQKAKYSLPTFIANAQFPSIKATNCWNPSIKDGEPVVLNKIELGVPSPGHPEGTKMFIITAGNAQGKTVFMLQIPIAVLLSQGLGVVPGEELSQTPYNHLVSFIKTETDTSKGESLFKNTCKRGKVCMDIVQNGRGNKLFVMDEIYNGTKHKLAQSTVYKFTEKVGNLPKVNSIITTHLKAITRLPSSYPVHFMNLKANAGHIEQGIGNFETEEEGLRIIAEELGTDFANLVKEDIKQQSIHDYWDQLGRVNNLVAVARRDFPALRQQVGAPMLDGVIINLNDSQLHADWEQKINNPDIDEINAIIQRIRHPRFDSFFDLLRHVAILGRTSPEMQQQTFKDLMLDILAHCADATATAQSAPWLARITQIEEQINQEHERRAKLQQEIEALDSVRNREQTLEQQLLSERHATEAITRQTEEKAQEIDDTERELALRQNFRRLQFALNQQNLELRDAIEEARRLIDSLRTQPNAQHQQQDN